MNAWQECKALLAEWLWWQECKADETLLAECHMLVGLDGLMDQYREWERLAIERKWPGMTVTAEELQEKKEQQVCLCGVSLSGTMSIS